MGSMLNERLCLLLNVAPRLNNQEMQSTDHCSKNCISKNSSPSRQALDRGLVSSTRKRWKHMTRLQVELGHSLVFVTICLLPLLLTNPVSSRDIYSSSPNWSKTSANPPQQVSPTANGGDALAPFNAIPFKDRKDEQFLWNELIKKSSSAGYEHVSSADLPAEFRGLDGEAKENAPKEQSRLAKLCEQTSSVLASVLPAPFGGHKRSILCQFFGQVPLIRGNQSKQQQQVTHNQTPSHGAPILSGPHPFDPYSSVAVLHQPQQQPLTMTLSSGMHPIQLVLEQQQRQHLIKSALAQTPPSDLPIQTNQLHPQPISALQHQTRPQPTLLDQDLKSSASILDYSYQQRVEPPNGLRAGLKKLEENSDSNKQNIKYSTSVSDSHVASSSFKPMSITPKQQLSTSGWKIFNQLPTEQVTTQSPTKVEIHPQTSGALHSPSTFNSSTVESNAKKEKSPLKNPSAVSPTSMISSTTTTTLPHKPNRLNETQNHPNNHTDTQQSNVHYLVMGRPPSYGVLGNTRVISEELNKNLTTSFTQTPKQSLMVTKRSKALNPTTRAAPIGEVDEQSEVRTIEVVAQVNNSSNSEAAKRTTPTSNSTVFSSSTDKPLTSDLKQVQKREELVIASINNLTRIAFGNHLRDTVKVINKLIDQQSSLFDGNSNKGKINHVNNPDPLSTSESKIANNTLVLRASSSSSVGHLKEVDDKALGEASISKSRQKQMTAQEHANKPNKKPKKQPTSTETTRSVRYHNLQQSNSTHASKEQLPRSVPKQITLKPSKSASLGIDSIGSSSRKFGGSSREVRRLSSLGSSSTRNSRGTASSSSMILPGQRQKTTPPTDDFEPLPTVTISDIHRDRSPWQFSSAPLRTKPTTKVGAQQQVTNAVQGSVTPRISLTSTTKAITKQKELASQMFSKGLYKMTDAALPTTQSESKSITEMLKNWPSTRKQFEPINNKLMETTPAFNSKSNKLQSFKTYEQNSKVDSLTALKMSLTTQSSLGGSLNTNKNEISGTQSRWIPTVTGPYSLTTLKSSTTTNTMAPTSTTSTAAPTTSTTSTRSNQSSTVDHDDLSKDVDSLLDNTTGHITYTTSKETMSQNDLNELKASDSISRYTTHWNQADTGNEILATTRRFYQQPMPQLANAGEFFNAETIASWPEKYQAALSSTLEADKTTSSYASETTRRNGETYEGASSKAPIQTTTTARHRFTEPTTTDVRQTTLSDYLATRTTQPVFTQSSSTGKIVNNFLSGSVTVLPANHKLASTAVDQTSTSISPELEIKSETTSARMFDEEGKSSESKPTTTSPFKQNDSLAPSSYILIDPTLNKANYSLPQHGFDSLQTISESGGIDVPYTSKFPRILDDFLMPSGSAANPRQQELQQVDLKNLNSNNSNSSLRPPYIDLAQSNEDVEFQQKDFNSSTPIDPYDYQTESIKNKPYVSRKLYELLVPSTKNFVGPQNPLNQAGFNLSALKFLAQNLLSTSTPQNSSSSSPPTDFSVQSPGEHDMEQLSNNGTNASEKLINLLSANLPGNYYDLLLNETQSNTDQNLTDSNKSILSRAGSLLSNLKQLEHKKAAAILAAIRYQVPSPLVRPWDANSGIQTLVDGHNSSQQSTNVARMDSLNRFNGYETVSSGPNPKGSTFVARANALANALLLRQRLISRGELEARLRGYKKMRLEKNDTGHLSDLTIKRSDESYSLEDTTSDIPQNKLDDITIESMITEEPKLINSSILLDKLLSKDTSNLYQTSSETSESKNISTHNPTDTLKVREEQRLPQQNNEKQELGQGQFPKYIRLHDYQTAWSVKPPKTSLTSNDLTNMTAKLPRYNLDSSALVDKLRSTSARVIELLSIKGNKRDDLLDKDDESVRPAPTLDKNNSDTQSEDDEKNKKNQFQCLERQAGFYPDIGSACRTFYHCSNTGHLLTFNCPQQTRFDEKSLKCGPWFEVPCDLSRGKLIHTQSIV